MPVLKNRQKQIPGGLRFLIPEIGWKNRPNSSFEQIVMQVIAVRNANPAARAQHKWSVDPAVVRHEVDRYNAELCRQMGWMDYIEEGGAALPFGRPQPGAGAGLGSHNPLSAAHTVAAGAVAIVEWIASGADAVPAEQSEGRAQTCVQCPHNDQGDWTRFFTVPVSNGIRKQLERRFAMKLQTTVDDRLQICGVCWCPLKLKVHVPIASILARIPAEVRSAFPPHCWVVKESA